jgi:RNA polymerase sigma factor (sigma-70 family)
MNETDDHLLQQYARNNDRAAMDELIRRHINMVYAAARRQLRGNEHAADDVTQAVFMLLLRKAKSIHRGHLAGWLLQTTRYACANARKILVRRILHERQAAAHKTEAIVLPADDPLLLNLDKGIASLRAAEREIVVLRYLEGHELQDISVLLGITPFACRKRLTRALDRLRKLLSPKGSEVIGEGALLTLLQAASSSKAPSSIHIALTAASPQPLATEIFKETAMILKWIQIKGIAAAVICCFVVLATAGEISRRAYAEKPSTNPVEDKPSQVAAAAPTTQSSRADLMLDQRHLLNIGSAIQMYALRHNGHFPDSLGQTLQYIQPRTEWGNGPHPTATPTDKALLYLSPADARNKQVPNDPSPKWIDENTSYVYLANGKITQKDIPGEEWAKTAIAHGKLTEGYIVNTSDGKQVTLFPISMLDGHAEGENREYVERVIADSKNTFALEK